MSNRGKTWLAVKMLAKRIEREQIGVLLYLQCSVIE